MKTLERDLRSRALHETSLPIALDAASMPGARVLGSDGQVYESIRWPNVGSAYSWQSTAQVAETVAADVPRILAIETKVVVDRTIPEEVGVSYHTLDAALAYCSQFTNDHVADEVERKKLWIEIASGWTAREQIILRGVDLSNVTITAVDEVVTVETDYLTIATSAETQTARTVHDFINAAKTRAPSISGVIFRANGAVPPQDHETVSEIGSYTPLTRGLLIASGDAGVSLREEEFDGTSIPPRPGGIENFNYNVRVGTTANFALSGGSLSNAIAYGLRSEGTAGIRGSYITGCGDRSITNRGTMLLTQAGTGLGAVFPGIYTQDFRKTPGVDSSFDIEVNNGGQLRINGTGIRGGISRPANSFTREGFISDPRFPDASVNKADIVGTVSQSSGVVTGEVIERGTNLNGEYVRFADGTQICTRTFDLGDVTANGSGTFTAPYYTNAATVGFAATFVADPVVSFGFPTPALGGVMARMLMPAGYDVTTTGLTSLRVARVSDDATASIVVGTLTAIGRWF